MPPSARLCGDAGPQWGPITPLTQLKSPNPARELLPGGPRLGRDVTTDQEECLERGTHSL